jgi:ribosomal protein S18 acetylase RimI-like enzyme
LMTSGSAESARTLRPFGISQLLLAALAAAGLGYGLHHLPVLSGHDVVVVALAIGGALVSALFVARLMRPAPAAPSVLVARPGHSVVRTLHADEVDVLVALHRDALGHGFLIQLGPRFLRAYESTFLDSPHGVALVATVEDVPVGVLTGMLNRRAHVRWALRHRGMRLVVLGLAGLLGRPRLALRFARTRLSRYAAAWWRHRSPTESPRTPGTDLAVLSHVAVLPGARGWGTGRQLVEAFVASAAEGGASQLRLETRREEEGAGGFYDRLGWRRSGVHTTPDGAQMEVWALQISTGTAGA